MGGANCGGCDVVLSSSGTCHCGQCHRNFSVIRWFDAHRHYGKCRDPKNLKNRDGGPLLKLVGDKWVGAEPNPRFAKDEDE